MKKTSTNSQFADTEIQINDTNNEATALERWPSSQSNETRR